MGCWLPQLKTINFRLIIILLTIIGFSRGLSRFSLPQISFHHFFTLISSISFHFIRHCDGASGVVGRHPCYSLTYNIGASSHLIPRPDLVLDTSWYIIQSIIVFFPRAGLSLQTQRSPLYPLLSLFVSSYSSFIIMLSIIWYLLLPRTFFPFTIPSWARVRKSRYWGETLQVPQPLLWRNEASLPVQWRTMYFPLALQTLVCVHRVLSAHRAVLLCAQNT